MDNKEIAVEILKILVEPKSIGFGLEQHQLPANNAQINNLVAVYKTILAKLEEKEGSHR